VSIIDHLAHASLPQAAAEEWEGAVELVAAGTSRVVARTVTSLRVLVLAATVAVEHGETRWNSSPNDAQSDWARGQRQGQHGGRGQGGSHHGHGSARQGPRDGCVCPFYGAPRGCIQGDDCPFLHE
jgi:hypothetical protein